MPSPAWLFLIVTSSTAGDIFGTSTWPVTWQMLDLLSGTFSVFMLVIITFYAGELTWREREHRLDQIHDALPIPTWLPFLGKLFALMLVPVVLQALLMLCGLGIQIAKGYHHYEFGLYFKGLFGIELIDYWLVCVLAMAVHSLVNQKYLGHFIMIVYFIVMSFASLFGFEHNLYKYGATPPYIYSDMNGFGHFLLRVRVFQAYWAAAALLLAVAAYLFWVRGTVAGWRERVAIARQRFTRPVGRADRRRRAVDGGPGRVHFLQHQRPQPLPDGRRPAGAAGRLREEIQEPGPRAATQDHRGQGRRRSVPARAAGADARAVHAREQDGQADRHRAPAVRFLERTAG